MLDESATRLERLSDSSGGKEFVQWTQHGPGRSKTEPLKRWEICSEAQPFLQQRGIFPLFFGRGQSAKNIDPMTWLMAKILKVENVPVIPKRRQGNRNRRCCYRKSGHYCWIQHPYRCWQNDPLASPSSAWHNQWNAIWRTKAGRGPAGVLRIYCRQYPCVSQCKLWYRIFKTRICFIRHEFEQYISVYAANEQKAVPTFA